jgi:translation initiation factor IF-2
MRVFEFAKVLGMPSKALMSDLRPLNVEVPNHMSALDDQIVVRICEKYSFPVPESVLASLEKNKAKAAAEAKKQAAAAAKARKTQEEEESRQAEEKRRLRPADVESPAAGDAPSGDRAGPSATRESESETDESLSLKKDIESAWSAPTADSSPKIRFDVEAREDKVPPPPAVETTDAAADEDEVAAVPSRMGKVTPLYRAGTPRHAPRSAERPDYGRRRKSSGPGYRDKSMRRSPRERAAAPSRTKDSDKPVISVRGPVVVKDLAEMMNIKPNELIADLMSINVFAAIQQTLDVAVARQIAEKRGFDFRHEKKLDEHRQAMRQQQAAETEEEQDRPEDLLPRAPVVTFLGHVDHGKTSLLDRIRKTRVAAGESGGITQHIGAYTVETNGARITFLDTPGHAAFTAMRARGAMLTDIAVLIVAADDGIMPQTREAIDHARAAGTSIMVAINKIDLPGANVAGVMSQLQAEGLAPEEWGGEVICCPVSAETGEGIDHLLEMIALQSEVLELKANPKARARGYVIESQLETGMGPTANLLVKNGTLHVGDIVLCGHLYGRVKALINDHGVKIKSAPPSTPVKALGLSGVPEAGTEFSVCANERVARASAGEKKEDLRSGQLDAVKKTSLENLLQNMGQSEVKQLNLILKADTQGSVEAVAQSLNEIKSDKAALNILHTGTGNIVANDIMLASASNAVVVGFHVSKEPGIDAVVKHEGVEVRLYRIIYELIDEVRNAMVGLLAPKIEETVLGRAEIRQVFTMGKRSKIAGCMVVKGRVNPKARVRVLRDQETLHEGKISSLKRFQDDAAEVREGMECGIRLDKFLDFAEGDILEFYELKEVQQTL